MISSKYYSEELINPNYPPYHVGDDLEAYFIKFYFNNKEEIDKTGFNFLPIKWTYIYNNSPNLSYSLHTDLQNLDTTKKYFTVSQHDDAPAHTLPKDTVNFSAGGNQLNTIPIPLICSPLKAPTNTRKDIFCSFVGSVNQNLPGPASIGHSIRMQMLNTLVGNSDYILKPKHWSPDITESRQDLFIDITSRSKFTLCPRGYGASSFRLYEAMQLQSIPVYIYRNQPHLPFSSDIDWESICILVEESNICHIDKILKSISDDEYNKKINKINEIYDNYFTLESTARAIVQILKQINKP